MSLRLELLIFYLISLTLKLNGLASAIVLLFELTEAGEFLNYPSNGK